MRSTNSDWYERNAAEFCLRTVSIDMEDAHERFLKHVPPNGHILDVGCGSGRDSKRFAERGHCVDSRDASPAIAAEALAITGVSVRVENMLDMTDRNAFDGVWACAALLHLDADEFQDAIRRLVLALRPNGTLYISLKQSERTPPDDGREFKFWDPQAAIETILNAGASCNLPLKVVDSWSAKEQAARETRWINLIFQRD